MVDALIFITDILFECLGVAVFLCVVWHLMVALASRKEK